MGPEVWVAGRPLTSIAAWGELEVTTRHPLGSWEAKWSMPLDPWRRPPELRADAPVQVKVGPHCIWCGDLAEPNWAEGTFAAVGACRQGEGAPCFDSAGETTSTPDVAIDQAIADGFVDWTRPASISTVPLTTGDNTDAPNYLSALLDAFGPWYVDPFLNVRTAADPTTPTALLMPDNGVLGVAVESQVGTVFGRYLDSTTYTNKTVYFGTGRPAQLVNYLDRGPMTAVEATALCQALWEPLQAQTGWTNGLTVRPGELRSIGGQELPLWRFQAGPKGMVRLLGVRDLRGLSSNTNIVAAETIWTATGDEALRINPVGKVARDIRSMAEAQGGVLR